MTALFFFNRNFMHDICKHQNQVVLSVLNTVCFDHILSSPDLPCSAAPSIPTKTHATSPSIPICLIQVSLDLWPSTEAYWHTKGCTLRENWLYLTQTIRIYNCSLVRSDLCMQLPSPWWELSCFSLHRYCARCYSHLEYICEVPPLCRNHSIVVIHYFCLLYSCKILFCIGPLPYQERVWKIHLS